MRKEINIKNRYLLFGILFGCVFPLFSVLIDCCLIRKDTFSFSKLGIIFNENPLHYIIASAPFFLGLAFYIAGRFAYRQQLSNHALQQSNDQLKLLNESYNTFNYHVSHDLKTIITNGQSLAMMIRKYAEKNDSGKVLELSEMLRQTCESGSGTINGFLQLHRMTSVNPGDHEVDIPLVPVIEELRDQLSAHHDIEIQIRVREFENLPMPAARIRSLFQNLLSNSVRYGYEKVEVKIELIKTDKHLKIHYHDNGRGIDMKKHGHRLFQPFARIEETHTAGSTGIGLYLIKQMLSLYNATISLNSEPGKGVSIEIVFPQG
ncbi:MAG: HAMP domain-containing histidine kinase [Bacteroidia bacterium]|jgi:signal transduction histidine kinase|nr:HAMP domain-containing histidine kinase [Bacteroidia bacterium]